MKTEAYKKRVSEPERRPMKKIRRERRESRTPWNDIHRPAPARNHAVAPTAPPRSICLDSKTPDSFTITWKKPLSHKTYKEVSQYHYIITDVKTRRVVKDGFTPYQKITTTGLHPYQKYQCKVAAVAEAEGPFSNPETVTTFPDFPTAPPSSIIVPSISSTGFTISWDAPPPQSINGRIHMYHYYIMYETGEIVSDAVTTSQSVTITGLHPSCKYEYTIAAINMAQLQGPFSRRATVQTKNDVPTAPPRDIMIFSTDSTSLTISWTAPPPQSYNGRLKYHFHVTEKETGHVHDGFTHFELTKVTGLYPYNKYQCKVAAVTTEKGPYSNPVTKQTNIHGIPPSQQDYPSRSDGLKLPPLHDRETILSQPSSDISNKRTVPAKPKKTGIRRICCSWRPGKNMPSSISSDNERKEIQPPRRRDLLPDRPKLDKRAHDIKTVSATSQPGVRGLRNIGNTCFMNSALQCLSNTTTFREFFTAPSFPTELQNTLAGSLSRLLKEMWTPAVYCVNPTDFKCAIGEFAPRFMGYSQQDAQEFLTFLLDGLEEDLMKYSKKSDIACGLPDIGLSTAEGNSLIGKLFRGKWRYRLTCGECEQPLDTDDPFVFLSIPIPDNREVCTLDECLSEFTKVSRSGEKNWFCHSCDREAELIKKTDIIELPNFLIVYLKKFCITMYGRDKVHTLVKFPMELSLQNYDSGDVITYSLYAVINHDGSLYGGHYYTYAKNGDSWIHFNDAQVTVVQQQDVVTSSAYVLFYEKHNHLSRI